MSERPIAVGDMVQVIRPRECCQHASRFGIIFTVAEIRLAGNIRCILCGNVFPCQRVSDGVKEGWWELSRLKRIDPPPPQDETTTEREIMA